MDHIIFSKMNLENKKRYKQKKNIPFVVPKKDNYKNSIKLKAELEKQINSVKELADKFKFNPYLVMKIELDEECIFTASEEEKLEYFGVKIIDKESKQLQIVFSNDLKLVNFKQALEEYKNGEIAITNIKYNDLFSKIKSIEAWNEKDRLNCSIDILKKDGYLDCYLWVFDEIEESTEKMDEFIGFVNNTDKGKVTDKYIGESIVIARIKINSINVVEELSHNPLVYKIEEIEKVNIRDSEPLKVKNTKIDDLEYDFSKMNGRNASICVIDSGVFKQHPLFKGVIGEGKTFYCTDSYEFSDNDFDGHGTAVASVCEYGDFSYNQKFIPEIYIHSAKIHDGTYTNPVALWEKDLEKNIGNLTNDERLAIGDFNNGEMSFEEVISYFRTDIQPYAKLAYSRYCNMYDKLIPNQMKEIVEYFYNTYNCRIFNLSQGDKKQVYSNGKPRAWSCVLDELQHKYNIIFVISTGNYQYEEFDYYKNIINNYPKYFYNNYNCKLIEPSNSINSLTVGGLAINNNVQSVRVNLLDEMAITKENEISSITRVGPGILKSIKPDFVAYAGDRGIKHFSPNTSMPMNNDLLGKLLFANDVKNGLFRYDCGTSFAAPYISHILGNILNRYPDLSNNMLRAILASSAGYISETINQIKSAMITDKEVNKEFIIKAGKNINIYKKMIAYTLGYGIPVKEKCLESLENRVALMADMNKDEDKIKTDEIHIFKIPLLDKFRKSKGNKRVIISLAYNPPVKSTRLDYIGAVLGFDLVKGSDLKKVLLAFEEQKNKDEHQSIAKKYKCDFDISHTIRGKGTLQRGIFKFSRDSNFTDELYLIVNCKKNWTDKAQKYALCVTLESDDDELKMYQEIKDTINLQNKNIIERMVRI